MPFMRMVGCLYFIMEVGKVVKALHKSNGEMEENEIKRRVRILCRKSIKAWYLSSFKEEEEEKVLEHMIDMIEIEVQKTIKTNYTINKFKEKRVRDESADGFNEQLIAYCLQKTAMSVEITLASGFFDEIHHATNCEIKDLEEQIKKMFEVSVVSMLCIVIVMVIAKSTMHWIMTFASVSIAASLAAATILIILVGVEETTMIAEFAIAMMRRIVGM